MPRYRFSETREPYVPGSEGLRFPDAKAARQHAERHPHDLAAVCSRAAFACEIGVLNEDGEQAALVPAGETVSPDPLA